MATLAYFAYGSNMLDARLRERLPRVVRVGPARLPGWTLRFDKRGGKDGSGKCHIMPTDAAGACVWGVLYRMTDAERAELDRIEGVGGGYTVAWVGVEHAASGATVEAFYYAANPAWIDATRVPFDWYVALVLAGAIAHGFPADYIDAIRAFECRPDDDGARAARAWRLLDGSGTDMRGGAGGAAR